MAERLRGERLQIMLTPEELELIDTFRFEKRMPSRAATVRELFKRGLATVYDMGWNVVAIAPDEGRIEATDTTFFFGFTDDIVIRVKPAGFGAKLDIRSESRVGESDGGRNARRISAFRKQLNKESN